MPRTVHHYRKCDALVMVVKNILTLSAAELEDLIEVNTAYVADDENGDYVVIRDKP